MKKSTLIILSAIAAIIVLFIMGASYSNTEKKLRSKATAQKQVVEASFDNMWKSIQQVADVSDEYKNAFKDIYPKLIEGRYGNDKDGTLMKFITESNPAFDTKLYSNLQNVIESERKSFFNEQKKLADIANEHRISKSTFPASLFIGSRPDIEVVIVSSQKTKDIISSGKEDDIKIFKK